MKKSYKSIFAAFLAICTCVSLVGCGGGEPSEQDIENRLEQLDEMPDDEAEKEIEKALEALDENSTASEDPQAAAAAKYLAEKIFNSAQGYIDRISIDGKPVPDFNEIKYELLEEKSGKLEAEINGKKKKVKWDLDDADIYGEVRNYAVKYVTVTVDGVSCTYPEGADQLEIVDAFENLTVTFSGTAPRSKVTISGGNSLCSYTADVESGMFNGDVVTISAEFKTPQEGKVLSEEKREYTVEGLASYAMKIDDIPADMQDKMKKQAEDALIARTSSWVEGNSLKSIEFLGYYFLTVKDGFTESPTNDIYLVYKATANITGIPDEKKNDKSAEPECGEEVYYTFYRYTDIVILSDGKCSLDLSAGKMTENSVKTDHGLWYWGSFEHYSLPGYKDLDSMFNKCVTGKIEKYDYESTVN